MKHSVQPLVFAIGVLLATTSVAVAQTTPLSPPATPAPSGLTIQEGQRAASPPAEKVIDGPVKKIDPATQTVQVGWFLGLFHTTLEVTKDTEIAVNGMTASVLDIREGDEVKASYEERNGKNIARAIEVMEAEPRLGASAPQRSPVTFRPPSMSSSQGSEAPSTGAPKTP